MTSFNAMCIVFYALSDHYYCELLLHLTAFTDWMHCCSSAQERSLLLPHQFHCCMIVSNLSAIRYNLQLLPPCCLRLFHFLCHCCAVRVQWFACRKTLSFVVLKCHWRCAQREELVHEKADKTHGLVTWPADSIYFYHRYQPLALDLDMRGPRWLRLT